MSSTASTEPSTGASSHPPILLAALTACAAGVAFLFGVEQLRNYDIWWHLRTGEWILANGSVPHADPFTFSAPGAEWIPHYWLADVGLALVHRTFSLNGLILFKAAVIATAFALVYRIMLRLRVNPYLGLGLIVLAVAEARFRFMVRPQMFMFLFAAVTLWLLFSAAGQRRWRRLWALVPLTALWANTHASFFLCIAFAGCLLAERTVLWLDDRYRVRSGERRPPLALAAVVAAMVAAVFATPMGVDLPRWVIGDFTSYAVTRTVTLEEHRALAWGEHPIFWVMMFATIASFALTRRRTRIFHVLLVLGTSILAIQSVRLVALAVLVYAPVLGIGLQAGLERLARRVRPPPWRWQLAALPLLALAVWFAFGRIYRPERVYRHGLGVMERRYPAASVELLRSVGFSGNLFNSWEFGGYVLWQLPEARVFCDGRTLAAVLAELDRTRAMQPRELAAYMEQHAVDGALVRPGDEPYTSFFAMSPHFDAVSFDDRAVVYLRRGKFAVPGANGGAVGFRLIRPDSYDLSYLPALARGPDAAEAEAELRRAVELSPDAFLPHLMLGEFLDAQGRPEAVGEYRAAMDANLSFGVVHFAIGVRTARAAIRHGQWQRAIDAIRRSIEIKADAESYYLLGSALYMSGELDEAESALESALEQQPDHQPALVNLGYLYVDTERFAKARKRFARARELAPGDPNALYGLALATHLGGNRRAALPLWREFLANHGDSKWAAKARAYLAEAQR